MPRRRPARQPSSLSRSFHADSCNQVGRAFSLMISLAPIRYAEVLSRHGGPVARLEHAPARVLGRKCSQAVAYLRDDLMPSSFRLATCTGQPDGAGCHQSTQIACHMAVSEALERWAVHHSRAHPESANCGMEHDNSSNGFAAYPGLFRRQARKAAFRESIERHCLICWWEGLLGYHPLTDPQPALRAIQLENPFSRHVVVVLWTYHHGHHVYAFGAGESCKLAVWRACVELERTQMLIDHIVDHKTKYPEAPMTNLFERRIDFFSTEEGFSLFLSRLESPAPKKPAKLRLLHDASVEGPWERYAGVWRTVLEAPSREYLSDVADYFFW